jgi:Beta-propeller repeat
MYQINAFLQHWRTGEVRITIARVIISLLAGVGTCAGIPTAHADTTPTTYWTHQFGAITGASTNDSALAIDSDGSAYIVGTIDGALPDQLHTGGRDVFIRKYSHAGELVWTDQFGTAGEDVAYGVAIGAEGVYVTGLVDGTLPGETALGGTDVFMRAYTPSGTVLWTHQFGTDSNDTGAGIAYAPSGPYAGLYVGGTTNGTFSGETNLGESDAFLAKYDTLGTLAWVTQYGTSAGDETSGIAANQDGVFTVGYLETGGFLNAFDSSGVILWSQTYGTTSGMTSIEVSGVTVAGTSIYITGGVYGTFEDTVEIGDSDAFLLKYSTVGTPIWRKQFGTTATDKAGAVSVANHTVDTGLILTTGNTVGTLPGATSTGLSDVFVQAFNPDGTPAWTSQFGTSGYDTSHGLSVSTGYAFVVGNTNGVFPGEITTGGDDVFISHLSWSDDYDNDSIRNEIDIYPQYPSTEFSDEVSGGTSYGYINDSNDQALHIQDAQLPEEGIDIIVESTGGVEPAQVSVCEPQTTFTLTPEDIVVVTCASVHTRIENGDVEALFRAADGSEIEGVLPENTQLSYDQDDNTFVSDIHNPETIDLTVGSSTYSINPGDTLSIPTDTTGPIATTTVITPNPLQVDTAFSVTSILNDVSTGSSSITHAYVSIDGAATTSMNATDGVFDESTEAVSVSYPAYTDPGVHNVCVWGEDIHGNIGTEECVFLAVYDPEGGFVTGSGKMQSPVGAYLPNPNLTGTIEFGFVSKYKRHVQLPQGETEFKFKVADLKFRSNQYDWLVVLGPRAQYRGTGTINGSGNYGFILTVIDEARPGGGTTDKLRMKIWDKNNGNALVYDNKLGAPDTDDPVTSIQHGNIMIHN